MNDEAAGGSGSAKDIFADAIEMSPDGRAEFVRRSCAGDGALLDEVLNLIDNHAKAIGFLETPLGEAAVGTGVGVEGPGTVIGRYRLLERIGEGGFGAVYLAEQREPVVRHVALKVIKAGMDTAQVIARFEAERQALALMDHPNIAKVLDAGSTERGRPYFVMELVKGEPITAYCDRNQLTVPQRLELFAQVCTAVQHAHTKGVVHRDIKPSNVLVSHGDGRADVRVIDFGIAKAVEHTRAGRQAFTQTNQLLGTPEYMSPEQAAGEADIDTRTDVYSLGVLLYELLTGSTPFEGRGLRSAAYGEIQRIIKEEEPPKPSTRLSSLESLPSVAAQRKTEPARLGRTVRGDLDWIVMKALEKDRARRYETANGLAADVQRYLAGEAVAAAPPSRAYQAKKFVRRHRVGVVAGSLVGAALVLGMAGTSLGLVWAKEEQRKADRAAASEAEQRKAAEASEKTAREQETLAEAAAAAEKARADELKHVSDFQAEMLAGIDPTAAGKLLTRDVAGRLEAALTKAGVPEAERAAQVESFKGLWGKVNATDAARELINTTILKPAVGAIDEKFNAQPVVDARLRQVLADCYYELGLFDAAMPLQTGALETRRRVLGEEHTDTLASINWMASLLQAQGKYAQSEPFRAEVLDKRRRTLGEEHPDTLEAITNMGFLFKEQGRLAEAEPYYTEAVEKYRRVLGSEHRHTLTAINNLASLLQARGKYAAAEALDREALATRRRVLGDEHTETLQSMHNLAYLLQLEGKYAEAESIRREVLEKCRRLLGEDHPNTIKTINTMGLLLSAQGKLTEAEVFYREALEKRRRVLGESHPDTLLSMLSVGSLLQSQGKLAESEPFRREALEKCRRLLGEEHPLTLTAINDMGYLLMAQGKPDEAEPYYRDALEKRRRALGAEHADTLASINNMGYLLLIQGRLAEAEPYLRDALDKRGRVLGGEHPETLGSVINMAAWLQAGGRFADAEAMLAPAAATAEAKLPARNKSRIGVTRAMRKLYEAWETAEPGKGYGAKAGEWMVKLEGEGR